MQITRRAVSRGLAAVGGGAVLPFGGAARAAVLPDPVSCTLVAEAGSGAIRLRSGPCERRFSPCSSFKLPLAVMGFDAGILQDSHHPQWDYRPEFRAAFDRDKRPVDPALWLSQSVVWFSQEITRRLGRARFAAYVRRFGYGNLDVSGHPGADGLTKAWLMSSLQVSPDEQVAFLRRFLGRRLGVSDRAYAMTRAAIATYPAAAAWTVYGKSGSGALTDAAGRAIEARPLGWFVGWAEKAGRRVVFARCHVADAAGEVPGGTLARADTLDRLHAWAGD